MAITIKISGLPLCGSRTIRLDEIAKVCLRDLFVNYLPTDSQSLFKSLFRHDKLKPGYVILVNGRNITQLEGLDTIVKDGETVLITVHVVGG